MSSDEYKSVIFNNSICSIFDLTLNRKTIATLKTLQNNALITAKLDDTGTVISYMLTDKGFDEIALNFPFFRFINKEWDGKWRILSYEIPERKRELRDKLRRDVASWGLGPWHRSFWLTPHPIIPWLKMRVSDKEIETYVQAFESDHTFGNKEVLIEKVWQKTSLEKKYRALFKAWHATLSTDQNNIQKMQSVVTDYVAILKDDPGLPKQLVGESWIGFEALNLFREIRNILLTEPVPTPAPTPSLV
jgi:phenylacetic acid degradation operon negative regulatory protein